MAPPSLRALASAALASLPLVSALGQKPIVAFEPSDGALQIAGGEIGAGQIRVSDGEFWGVVRAAGDLAADFGRVTGTNYSLSTGEAGAAAAEYTFEPADVSDNTVVSRGPPSSSPADVSIFVWRVMRFGPLFRPVCTWCLHKGCCRVGAQRSAHLHGRGGTRRAPALGTTHPG